MTDGLGGGYPGARNRYIWVHNTNEENAPPVMASSLHDFPGKKQDVSWGVFPLKGRDVLYVASNGGGGYLDPFTRNPEAVLNDVRNRIASRKAAREVYGTVISEALVHDVRATLELRERLASRRGNGAASGMSPRVSETLNIRTMPEGVRICCRSCAHALAPAGHAWKPSSVIHEMSTDAAVGADSMEGAATILRLFICPSCRAVLDSETALPGEPFLDDLVSI